MRPKKSPAEKSAGLQEEEERDTLILMVSACIGFFLNKLSP
jgi:hypothetical protein